MGVLVFFLVISFIWAGDQKGFYKKVHSFKPPFLYGKTTNIPYWTYSGSSVATEKFVRIVPAVQSRVGRMWNDIEFRLKNWEIVLDFHIHNTQSPGADGLAVWIVEKTNEEGPLFGMTSKFKGLGILFDTYDNNHNGDNPAVIVITNDGTDRAWDIDNDFKADELGRCISHFRNPINSQAAVKIRYFQGILKIVVDTVGKGQFVDCMDIPFEFPEGRFNLGITAATGGLTDYHDVLRLETNELSDKGTKDRRRGKKKGWYDPYNTKEREEEVQKQKEKRKRDEDLQQEAMQDGGRRGEEKKKFEDIQYGIRKQKNAEEVEKEKAEAEKTTKFFEDLKKRLEETKGETEDDILKVVLSSLQEVVGTLQMGSTKFDVTQLIRRIEAISDSQVSIGNQQVSVVKEVQSEMSELTTTLTEQTNQLADDLRNLNRHLSSLGGDVNEMQKKTERLSSDLDSKTRDIHVKYEKGRSNFVFYFIVLFEIVFVVAALFYKKYSDEKRKKLL